MKCREFPVWLADRQESFHPSALEASPQRDLYPEQGRQEWQWSVRPRPGLLPERWQHRARRHSGHPSYREVFPPEEWLPSHPESLLPELSRREVSRGRPAQAEHCGLLDSVLHASHLYLSSESYRLRPACRPFHRWQHSDHPWSVALLSPPRADPSARSPSLALRKSVVVLHADLQPRYGPDALCVPDAWHLRAALRLARWGRWQLLGRQVPR